VPAKADVETQAVRLRSDCYGDGSETARYAAHEEPDWRYELAFSCRENDVGRERRSNEFWCFCAL
jgi:hypothetical protein